MSGPPHSCTAAMPNAAARRNAARCASPLGRGIDPNAAARTTWCASRRTHPDASKPTAAATCGAAASNADEHNAECIDACDR